MTDPERDPVREFAATIPRPMPDPGVIPMAEETVRLDEFSAAMAKFQCQVKNPPLNGKNAFFSSNYALLQDVLDTVRKPLGENGLAAMQRVNSRLITRADGEPGAAITIATTIYHASGQWVRSYSQYPVVREKSPKTGRYSVSWSQAIKGATTYARTNELCSLLGVAGGFDDDGESGNSRDDKAEKRSQPVAPKPSIPRGNVQGPVSGEVDKPAGLATAAQKKELKGLCKLLGLTGKGTQERVKKYIGADADAKTLGGGQAHLLIVRLRMELAKLEKEHNDQKIHNEALEGSQDGYGSGE